MIARTVLAGLALIAPPAAAAEPPESMAGMLAAHNEVRAEVGVPPLEWSPELAQTAADWAEKLAAGRCEMRHPDTDEYGQNLAWYFNKTPSPREVVADWAAEKQWYDPRQDSCAAGKQCGHYTQIVWRETERVGCAKASCDGKREIWACDYAPPGNVVGRKPY